jgi:hypothetical protein
MPPLQCVICNEDDESVLHEIITCSQAIQVWRDNQLWDSIEQTAGQFNNMENTFFTLLQNLQNMQTECFAIIL